MEVDEKPTEQYSDVGGLDKQIQELIEAIVLPMTHKDRFDAIGIKPPKGCLMYGPPGTGKTLLARACAAQTKGKLIAQTVSFGVTNIFDVLKIQSNNYRKGVSMTLWSRFLYSLKAL